MPELPEVETVRRGLEPLLVGRTVAGVELRRADLRRRFPKDFARRLRGRRVLGVARRAKYLLVRLDGGLVWLIHLGMTGRLVLSPPKGAGARPGKFHRDRDDNPAHDHVLVTLDDGAVLRFNDARRFGLMDLIDEAKLDRHKLLRHLGPEPLDAAFDGRALALRLKGKKTPIKAALLDQRVVAGIGNIYACEAMFRAGISPRRPARTVQGERAAKLARAIHAVLGAAIEAGGSSLRDYVQASGELGYFQHSFRVYDREGRACPVCGARIGRMVQSGRSTFYCAKCQR